MNVTPQAGENLCRMVIQTFLQWRPLRAALQSGGLEAKCRGQFAIALERWLIKQQNSDLLVLPEYSADGNIDFALVDPLSVGRPQLSVDTVIEVKFNYACQANGENGGEVGRQLSEAIRQALLYRTEARRPYLAAAMPSDVYVLHLIAAPVADVHHQNNPRDTGWRYFNQPDLENAHNRFHNAELNNNWIVLGEARSGGIDPRSSLLYCCLIGPPPPPAG